LRPRAASAAWRARHATSRALSAFGKDRIIVETVGVGQNSSISCAWPTPSRRARPEAGDTIQAVKAGL
jgi:putative protein kinase ArgK-like GTPase of G3E family